MSIELQEDQPTEGCEEIYDEFENDDRVTVHVLKKRINVNQSSVLLSMSDAVNNFILLEVFRFLSSEDLCHIAGVCRIFNEIATAQSLWKDLGCRNFHNIPEEISNLVPIPTAEQVALIIDSSLTLDAAIVKPDLSYKEIYRRAFEQMQCIGVRETRDSSQFYEAHGQDEQLFRMGKLMDLLQVYIYIPLVVISILVFVVLLALKLDNSVQVTYWVVFSPLMLLFGYTLGCMALSSVVLHNVYNSSSIFRGLGEHISTPVHFLMKEAPTAGKICAGVGILLCLVGCITLCMKLSGMVSFHWAFVFFPAWLILFLFCTTPCVGLIEDAGMFVLVGVLGWVPAFTLFLCLTLRLAAVEGQPLASGSFHYENIRMAAMFIPLWIIEGVAMLAALIFFCLAIYRHRLGYEDAYVWETGGVFGLSWCVLGLLLAFQIMLCLRVDGDGVDEYKPEDYVHLSAMDIVSPLCVLIGWLLVAVLVVLALFETPFQKFRRERLRDSAGLVKVFNV